MSAARVKEPLDAPAIPVGLLELTVAMIIAALGATLAMADRGLARLSVVAALRER